MKKWILFASFSVFAFAVTPTVANAQTNTAEVASVEVTPEKYADKLTERLDRVVDLTETQKTQAHAMYLNEARQMEIFKKNYSGNEETFRTERDTFRANMHAKLRAILTAEQQVKFDKIVAAKAVR